MKFYKTVLKHEQLLQMMNKVLCKINTFQSKHTFKSKIKNVINVMIVNDS